jgi:riboflavin kinase/FMN adenylyltransferase
VTVGNFDGVHLGHQALVRRVLEEARARGGTSAVLTFDPHPSVVLHPERAPSALMTLAQKSSVLAELGVERLAVLPFTGEIAKEEPGVFARMVLAETLGARAVVVGESFRFGRGRAGDLQALLSFGKELGFTVSGVPPVQSEGSPISSTRIRESLGNGAVGEARAMLGRSFFVEGVVVAGAGRGRTLGIPTANLDLVNETLPREGVYACFFETGGEAHPAIANVGRRPTFGGGAVILEAHLLDFSSDLYRARARVSFEARVRDERRFPGPDALLEQIRRDIEEARQVLEKS